MKAIEIYSKDNCPFCQYAIQKAENMKQYGIATYKVFNLNVDFDREKLIEKFPAARTFPQIKINQEHIGGYTELIKWLEKNSLDEDF